MGKGTTRTKHAMNVRKQHEMKSHPKNNKPVTLPGYHIEQCDGEPPKVAETYYFVKYERTSFSYCCSCGSKAINRGWDEDEHKDSKHHKIYMKEQQRLCRERYAIHEKEEKKKRMKEPGEIIIAHHIKRLKKLIARRLKDVVMELRSNDI